MISELTGKEFIFFDIGQTLLYPPNGDWVFTPMFMKIAGEKFTCIPAEKIEEVRRKGYCYLNEDHRMSTIEEEFLQFFHFYEIVSDDLALRLSHDDIRAITEDKVKNMKNMTPYPDALHVVRTLSEKFRLGIISDTWPSINNHLKNCGIYDYISTFTYSYMFGVLKPDDRLYVDALSKCCVAPEQTVFVDDVVKNLDGASKHGITPILIAAEPASDVSCEYRRIHRLTELII